MSLKSLTPNRNCFKWLHLKWCMKFASIFFGSKSHCSSNKLRDFLNTSHASGLPFPNIPEYLADPNHTNAWIFGPKVWGRWGSRPPCAQQAADAAVQFQRDLNGNAEQLEGLRRESEAAGARLQPSTRWTPLEPQERERERESYWQGRVRRLLPKQVMLRKFCLKILGQHFSSGNFLARFPLSTCTSRGDDERTPNTPAQIWARLMFFLPLIL